MRSRPTPITLPSHASILTGLYPTEHGIRDNAIFRLGGDARTLAEVFQEEGLRTAAFVGCYILDARFGLDQGFESYGSVAYSGLESLSQVLDRPADEVVDETLQWLDAIGDDEEFFLWVHFYDPHRPWRAPEPWPSRLGEAYAAEIAFTDFHLGRLREALTTRGFDDSLLWAVTADHGESLGQHDELSHGLFLYDSTMHVPLLLSGSAVGHLAGTNVPAPVSNAQLAPTLLESCGLPSDATGSRLDPLPIDGEQTGPDAVYLESQLPFHSYRWRATRGVVHGNVKYIDGPQPQLYRRDVDPHEQENLAPNKPERVVELEASLESILSQHRDLGLSAGRSTTAAERERLRQLGYLIAESEDDLDPVRPSSPRCAGQRGSRAGIGRSTRSHLCRSAQGEGSRGSR